MKYIAILDSDDELSEDEPSGIEECPVESFADSASIAFIFSDFWHYIGCIVAYNNA